MKRTPFDIYPNEKMLYNLPDDCGDLTMLELGNKKTMIDGAWVIWKDFFEILGFEHTSVDWNGQDGALARDLRKPLNLGTFDYVTNIGTTEHVSDQAGVWANILAALDVGSTLISVTPMPGDWWWHGEYYPTIPWYQSFADLNGLTLNHTHVFGDEKRNNIGVRMTMGSSLVPVVGMAMPDDELMFKNVMRSR